MTTALLIQPDRFIASAGKLDSSWRYVFFNPGSDMGFVNGRTAYTANGEGGTTYPGLNINSAEVTEFAVGGVGYSLTPLAI
jgi:hypothetical protein